MSDDDAPLEGRDLLDLAREGLSPRPSDRARLKRTILAATAAGAVTAGAASAQAAATGLALSTGVKLAIVAAVIGVTGLGALSLAGPEAPTDAPAEAPAASRSVRAAAPELVVPLAAPAVEAAAEPVVEVPIEAAPVVEAPAAPVARAVRTPSEPEPVDPIVEEARLLARAQAALDRDDGSAALDALDEHARRFAHGTMAEERAALRVLALALGDDHGRTCAAAETFLRTHAGSVHATRVRAACPD